MKTKIKLKTKPNEVLANKQAKQIFKDNPKLVISNTKGFPESKNRTVGYVLLSFATVVKIIERRKRK